MESVFGQIYIHQHARPVFTGASDLNIEKGEAHIRAILRKAYPTIRKASLTLLRKSKADFIEPPAWFARLQGELTFSLDRPAVTRTRGGSKLRRDTTAGKRSKR